LSDEALAEIEQHGTINNHKKNTIIINQKLPARR
jgi:hypothetical protein